MRRRQNRIGGRNCAHECHLPSRRIGSAIIVAEPEASPRHARGSVCINQDLSGRRRSPGRAA
ncbi:hypothetical protein FHX14_006671 [Rhizobium sp. BK619]|nr:hypothetical protein [Rhizobium sp. BK619]